MTATPDPGNAFALNVQAVSKLKYTARVSPRQGLKQASQQFEAMFIQKMLHGMRAAIPKSELLHSAQSDTYQQMMDQQWAQTLAKRGIGLADMMTQQLQGRVAAEQATPKPLGASEPIQAQKAAAEPTGKHNPTVGDTGAIISRGADKAAAGPDYPRRDRADSAGPMIDSNSAAPGRRGDTSASPLPDYASKFLDRMTAPADRASRQTGIPRRLILAQAALETGWGRHETTGDDGANSFNVFNIKATGWHGKTVHAATTEFQNGQARRTHAGFRTYRSYDQAFDDYARLMQQSPRYAAVRSAPDAVAAAQRLQSAGYATDPAYADKLVAIMNRIPAAPAPGAPQLVAQSAGQPAFDPAAQAAG